MRALAAALGLLALAGAARAEAEVLGVESATGGIWRPGRFSPVIVRLRVPPGRHLVRGRLESGRIAVTPLESAGGEETALLALLPERDAASVEIDAGGGFAALDLRLRVVPAGTPVVGVIAPLAGDPEVGRWRRALGWREVALPADGGPAVLRDVCDLVIGTAPAPGAPVPELPGPDQGPLLGGPSVGKFLADRLAGAEVTPARARAARGPIAAALALLVGTLLYGRRRGWRRSRRVLAVAALAAAMLGAWRLASAPEDRPRIAGRGVSFVRGDGSRTDLAVFAARGSETTDLRAPAGMLVRPIAGPGGRIGPYVLEAGRVLRDVRLGRGRLAFVRFDGPAADGRDAGLTDAFLARGDRVRWLGDVEAGDRPAWPDGEAGEPLERLWDRFRTNAPTRPLDIRGRLLRRIVRPATLPGLYGFLRAPPVLPADALGVETAELRWAVRVP